MNIQYKRQRNTL